LLKGERFSIVRRNRAGRGGLAKDKDDGMLHRLGQAKKGAGSTVAAVPTCQGGDPSSTTKLDGTIGKCVSAGEIRGKGKKK